MKKAKCLSARWGAALVTVCCAIGSIHPVSAQTISRLFAATETDPYLSYSWGEHWQVLREGRSLRGFSGSIRDFFCVGPKVFAGGADGLFVSDDYGETYRLVPYWKNGEIHLLHGARLFVLEPTLFAATGRGLYRSDDGADSWSRITTDLGRVHAIEWPGPEMFIAGTEGLFVTLDKGERFERLTGGLPSVPVLSLAVSRYFAVDPIVLVGLDAEGIYRSDNGGERFKRLGESEHRRWRVRAIQWWGRYLFVGTDEGLWISEDQGEHFSKAPVEIGEIYALSIPGAGTSSHSDVIVGGENGVYKSSDGGQTFRPIMEGLGESVVHRFATFPFPDSPKR